MSYKVEVLADNSGKYATNGLAFATEAEAERYGLDLALRWGQVRDWRVIESDETVTDVIEDGIRRKVGYSAEIGRV